MNIEQLRQERKMTQEALAEATGLAQCQISRYENGKLPSVTNAKKIAEALGIDWWLLFE